MAVLRALRRIAIGVFLLALFAVGWIGGDRFGLPQPVRDRVELAFGEARSRSTDAAKVSEEYLRARLEEARQFDFDVALPSLPDDVAEEDLEIGQTTPPTSGEQPGLSEPAPPQQEPTTTTLALLQLCPRMDVKNAPPADPDGRVRGIADRVTVGGVALRTTPVTEGCLSSGFGPRGGKLHKGIDFHHPTGSKVLAAAAGRIIEADYRDDYGNYLIIDHSQGVFTRYAHLARRSPGLTTGSSVSDGQRIGVMGKSGGWPMPIHLHYEVLVGDYDTRAKAFGLKPVDPLTGRGAPSA